MTWTALCLLLASGCTADPAPVTTRSVPRAEFLLAAGDSTYWAHSDGTQLRVRSAPLLLTRVDGALVELFLTDDASEYADASFASTQLWARPVMGSDSLLLHADSTVIRARAQWRRRFPSEEEITPDDEAANEEPATVVHETLDLLDVHGPYVSVERRFDADVANGPPHDHRIARFVVDLRSGTRQRVAMLFGATEGARVEAEAQRLLQQQLDSLRVAGTRGDARAAAALPTLGSFRFDAMSFAITSMRGAPAIEFLVAGRGTSGEALTLRLPVLAVNEPAWWREVRVTLPVWSADSALGVWSFPRYAVRARRVNEEQLAMTIASVDSAAHETPVVTAQPPVYQLIPLDAPALDSAARSALARTFDAATMLDAGAEQAANRRSTLSKRSRLIPVTLRP